MRTILKEIWHLPARIVYMFRYWEYVDWRVQTAFYIVVIMVMVVALGYGKGIWF